MIVLGIESSCDETAASLVEDGRRILSSVVASQVKTHADYGGIVPELASREHVDNLCFVVARCLEEAKVDWKDIDGIGVTRGPGLVGALLVGMAYAKAVALARGIPFVGVNHLQGHIFSIFLDHPAAELPALSLVVSGGHTNLYYLKAAGMIELLAKTRDDAAGEALDKLSKHLGLGYPGGPVIDRIAQGGNCEAVPFTIPRTSSRDLDFSFSGLKSAAIRYVERQRIQPVTKEQSAKGSVSQDILDLVASFQKAVVDQLLDRLCRGLDGRKAVAIHISGGVSCNSELRKRAKDVFEERNLPVYFPRPDLTTDNAAMIAAAAFDRLNRREKDSWELPVDSNLAVRETEK